jgi:hypothetical protein
MIKYVARLPGGRRSLLATALLAALCLQASAQWEPYQASDLPPADSTLEPPIAQPVEYPGWLAARFPVFSRRHIGWGRPLEGTSWRNRPWYFGWTVGGLFGQTVISDYLDQSDGWFFGCMIGYDFSHYWGSEGRLAFGDTNATFLLEDHQDTRVENTYADLNVLYYPWGDSRWRPFATIGMGLAGFHFEDESGRGVSKTVFGLPFGFGLKYQWRRWMTVRLDVKDNLSFGSSDIDSMHNWSITAGLEAHWGGDQSAKYRPW